MKRISVIIPSRGKSKQLKQLIINLEKYRNYIQIILIDNSRNRGLGKIYKTKKCLIYTTLNTPSVSASRNKGAQLAQTQNLYFLDDDVELSVKWFSALRHIIDHNKKDVIIGGPVRIDEKQKISVPKKYRYLVGEKDLGPTDKILKRDYLAGCNMMITKKLFDKLGGFPQSYGHKGSTLVPNEDVFIQEKARKMGYKIYYHSNLVIFHRKQSRSENLAHRVSLQGIYDRKLDRELNKVRLILRFIKYNVLIIGSKWFLSRKNPIKQHLDLIKYNSYLYGKSQTCQKINTRT